MKDRLLPLGLQRICTLLLTGLLLASCRGAHAASLPSVTVTSVTVADDSAKITIDPSSCPTAADFRILEVSNPTKVKYFGLWNLTGGWGGNALNFAKTASGAIAYPLTTVSVPNLTTNALVTVPAWQVQWNGLTAGQSMTFVVQAVNAVGPFPPGNQFDPATDQPLEACIDGMCMLGENYGTTLDGLTSINGQGPSTNVPVVIAQSAPFMVTTKVGAVPIPSGTDAITPLLDRFTDAGFATVPTLLPGVDEASWLMTTSRRSGTGIDHKWDVEAHNVDTNLTQPFVADNHFMDICSDGGTIGKSSNPPHCAHASLSISPQRTVGFTNGQILHVTGEWDSHHNLRRWAGISVFPANDRALSQYPENNAINTSDVAFLVEVESPQIFLEQCTGRQTPSSSASLPVLATLGFTRPLVFGPQGTATFWNPNLGPVPAPTTAVAYDQTGRGFDNRSRYDLFLSQTHVAFYEDGIKVAEYDLAKPLGFTQAKVYYTHYVYHTSLGLTELQEYAPWETFWINEVPYSDERHWDMCGYEVLPATTVWSSLAQRCQLRPSAPPVPAQ